MKICLLEPFFAGSHKRWAEGYQKHSRHEVKILSLDGRHWKWRMHGGAVSLAQVFNNLSYKPDLILATDMLDFSVFLALTGEKSAKIPTALYFHENQITYPWSPIDSDTSNNRDNHYGFINYTSALAADVVFFNSEYHRLSFCSALPNFLALFPDENEFQNISRIKDKSKVLYLGMDLINEEKNNLLTNNERPHILWNHRWEYDKNPTDYFEALFELSNAGKKFDLSVVGEQYKNSPEIFNTAKKKLENHIKHFGFVKSSEDYRQLLKTVDFLPVTSNQDFFGGSVVEAIYAGATPLLPDRLAYSEHIPKSVKSEYFYLNQVDFVEKLGHLIDDFDGAHQNESLVNFVSRYDWANLVNEYDNTFQKLTLV